MVNSQDTTTLQTEDVPLPDPSFTQTPTPNVEQPPVDHTPIETAEDGRRYDMWPGESFFCSLDFQQAANLLQMRMVSSLRLRGLCFRLAIKWTQETLRPRGFAPFEHADAHVPG